MLSFVATRSHLVNPHRLTRMLATASRFDIVVVGNGAVGASLACSLASRPSLRSLSIALVSPELNVPTVASQLEKRSLRVVALSNKSVNFLKGIGAFDRIPINRCAPVMKMDVWDRDCKMGVHFDADESRVDRLATIVETQLIVGAIHERIRELPNIEVISDGFVSEASLNDEGSARILKLASREISANLVVAADGKNSKLRTISGIKVSCVRYMRSGVVATLVVDGADTMTSYQRFLSTGPIALLPLGTEKSYNESRCLFSLVWTLPTNLAEAMVSLAPHDLATLITACINLPTFEVDIILDLLSKDSLDAVKHAKWRMSVFSETLDEGAKLEVKPYQNSSRQACFPLVMQHADNYQATRLALVGDAAHVVHPLGGQGLNIGLSDSSSLSRCIERGLLLGQDVGDQKILEAFERERRFKNKAILMGCDFIHSIFNEKADGPNFLRKAGMQIFNQVTPFKRIATKLVNGL